MTGNMTFDWQADLALIVQAARDAGAVALSARSA